MNNTKETIQNKTKQKKPYKRTTYAPTCGEDAGSGVEGGLDACLGDGDGLLLHGLVDRYLVVGVHLGAVGIVI